MMNPTNECPNCDEGSLTVYCTRADKEADVRVQYLKCRHCGYRPPEPRIVPLSSVPMQTRRFTIRRMASKRF